MEYTYTPGNLALCYGNIAHRWFTLWTAGWFSIAHGSTTRERPWNFHLLLGYSMIEPLEVWPSSMKIGFCKAIAFGFPLWDRWLIDDHKLFMHIHPIGWPWQAFLKPRPSSFSSRCCTSCLASPPWRRQPRCGVKMVVGPPFTIGKLVYVGLLH